MAVQTDPLRAALVDTNNNNSLALPLPEAANGFNDDQVLTAPKFNAVARAAGLFCNWLDQNSPRIELTNAAVTCRLSATGMRYTAGAGLQQPLATAGHYYIEGRLVQHTLDRCTARGQSPHLFNALRDHHLYLKSDASIRFEIVAVGSPTVGPLAGEYYNGFIRTDAANVVQHIGPGDAFFATGYAFDNQRNLIEAITVFRASALRIEKMSGGSAYLRFQEWGDMAPGNTVADNGWHFESYNAGASRLRLRQRYLTTDYTVIDFGHVSLGTQITVNYPVYISSAQPGAGTYAFSVESTDTLGKGSYFKTGRTAAATFEANSTGGVPVCLVPRAGSFTAGAANGSIQIENTSGFGDFQFKDANGVTRWAHATALARRASANAYTVTLSAIAVNTLGASVNFDIVSGARYRVSMGARMGRVAASTRDCTIVSTIGGVNMPWNGHTVALFQAGAASQLETTYHTGEYIWTAGATGNLSVVLTLGPINGAGNINIAYRWVYIEGPLD